MSTSNSTNQQDSWKRLRNITKEAHRDIERAIGLRALYEAGNTINAVEKVQKAGDDEVFILIRSSCLESWILTLSRLTDPSSKDRSSLGSAIDIIDQLLPHRAFMQSVGQDLAPLKRAQHLWTILKEDKLKSVENIKHLRDHATAHSIRHKLELNKPVNLLALRRTHRICVLIVAALEKATGTSQVSPSAQKMIWDERCRRYWASIGS